MIATPKWQAFVLTQTKAKTLKIAYDVPTKDLCTFRIGGNARQVIYPQNEQVLCDALRYLQEERIRYFVIGRGSNLLFSSKGFDGVIVSVRDLSAISQKGIRLSAQCGTNLASLAHYAAQHGLSGLEFACGIPATVGGAVCQNAGAHGSSISNVLEESCAYVKASDSVVFFDADAHRFAYRKSIYQEKKHVLLSATFVLKQDDPATIFARMTAYQNYRRTTQPLGLPSAGSAFLHTDGAEAPAKLIEQAGLKGYTVGGAQISQKHAGFIIHYGNASSDDVQQLISHCQTTIEEKYGVRMQSEIEFVSDAE